jgi:hypothetical protein
MKIITILLLTLCLVACTTKPATPTLQQISGSVIRKVHYPGNMYLLLVRTETDEYFVHVDKGTYELANINDYYIGPLESSSPDY